MSLRGSVHIAVRADGYIARKNDALDWLDRVQLAARHEGRAYIPAPVRPGLAPNIHS